MFDGWPVDLAPPLGLMKLLVAPESSITLWPNFYLRTLLGSLNNFLSCNSLLDLSLKVNDWCVSSWLTASLVKLARGFTLFQVGSIGARIADTGLAPQFGGKGRLQLDSIFVPPPPQTMPPSETWQDSGATCLLLSTVVCCCQLGGVGWEGLGLA